MTNDFIEIKDNLQKGPEDILNLTKYWLSSFLWWIVPLSIGWYAIFYTWLYAVAKRINPKAPDSHKLDVKKIGNFLVMAFACLILSMFFTLYLLGDFLDHFIEMIEEPDAFNQFSSSWTVKSNLLNLFSLGQLGLSIYVMLQVAKMLKASQMRAVNINADYIGFFFAILFFFVGVWKIQPLVNRLDRQANDFEDLDDVLQL